MITLNQLLFVSIVYLHLNYTNCGCLKAKLCCKNRNASCSATEVIATYGTGKIFDSTPSFTVTETIETTAAADGTTTRVLNVVTIPSDEGSNEETIQRHQNLFLDLNFIKNRNDTADDDRMEPVGYEDLDYGSGFEPGSANYDLNYTMGNLNIDQVSIDIENNSHYKFIEVFSPTDRNHKRRHVTDMQTFYNGGAKEISYLIVGEKTTEPMGMQADQPPVDSLNLGNTVSEKQCYCDEDCLFLNDCCADYAEACPAIDCSVSAWSEWSECSGRSVDPVCGPGVSFREKHIVQNPENGGVQCPTLREEKACYNANPSLECGVKASELALLLPYAYNDARKPGYKTNMYYDITLEPNMKPNDPSLSYCSIFQITWQSVNCTEDKHRTGISQNFRVHEQICVQCEPTASKSAKDRTHYYSISYNKRHTVTEEQELVDRMVEEDNNLKPRCTGDGAQNLETWFSLINRWVDSTSSYKNNCFGRWKLIKQEETCKCDKNYANLEKFIFV